MIKTRIGFDFDKIFVDYPPVVPSSLIEYLYKKKNHHLAYRIPGRLEQKLRILSHHPLFRQPIKRNISALKEIVDKDKYLIYLISSRFSFLRGRTDAWNKKQKMVKYFQEMYFNYKDEQPHIFKDKIIKKEKIDKFVDDDLELLLYLAKQNPAVDFYWASSSKYTYELPKNIQKVKNLVDFKNKFLAL